MPDPAAFDIARDDRERDIRDFRDDRFQERERERPPRQEERERVRPTTQEAIETIVNDDSVVLSPEAVRAINDPSIRMTRNGELARMTGRFGDQFRTVDLLRSRTPKKRSRGGKYSRTYKTVFRRIAPSYKLKSGKWKKNGFRSAVRAAHKETRRILKL